jgi:hypothetical protein
MKLEREKGAPGTAGSPVDPARLGRGPGLHWTGALALAGVVGFTEPAVAAPVFQTVGQTIPEFPTTGLGVYSTISLTGQTDLVGTLRVFLEVSGDYNGDLYFFLTHDSQMAVLLNRVGRTAGNPLGYGDAGLNVTFEDLAAGGEIHRYRQLLSGSDTQALSGPLTGTWAPDGRPVSPGVVTEASSRTAGLSVFGGGSADGDWTLFATDYETGGTHRLERWGLEFIPVPEPVGTGVFAVVAVVPVISRWRRHARV